MHTGSWESMREAFEWQEVKNRGSPFLIRKTIGARDTKFIDKVLLSQHQQEIITLVANYVDSIDKHDDII